MTLQRGWLAATLFLGGCLPISAASGATLAALQAPGESQANVVRVYSSPATSVDASAPMQVEPRDARVFSPIGIALERSPDAFSNPFDVQSVGLVGGIAAPDGAHVRPIPGFFDGTAEDGSLWRWRFMADQPGAHDYAVRWDDGAGSDVDGSVDVRPSSYRGPLTSVGTRGHRWARDGRAFVPFFVAGPGPFDVDDPRFPAFLDFAQDALGAHGVASVLTNRIWADCADQLDCSPDMARLSVARWRQLDRYLAALHERGMLAYLMFYSDDAARPRFAGGGEMEQILIHYAMARIGASPNVIIDSGIDITEYRSRDWSQWFAQSVSNADPYVHFVGSRHGGGSGEFECPRCLYDSRGEIHPTYVDIRAAMDATVKPVLYTDRWREDYRRGNFNADSLRRTMWSAAVGGGAGFIVGGAHGSLSLDDFESDLDNPAQFRAFADFWDSRPDLAHHGEPCKDAVSHGHCFGVPKREIAIYVPNGEPDPVTVFAIKPNEFTEAGWFNPRTGEVATAIAEGSPPSYTPPSGDDWVLSVEWLGHGDPPAPAIFLPRVERMSGATANDKTALPNPLVASARPITMSPQQQPGYVAYYLPIAGNGLVGWPTSATPGPEVSPGPSPTPLPNLPRGPYRGTDGEIYLPKLPSSDGCASTAFVQNVGAEPAKAIMVTFGTAAGECRMNCPGPQQILCSGLIRPGGVWKYDEAVFGAANSAVIYSVSVKLLSDIDVDLGFDAIVADLICETLKFGVREDCDDYARFVRAYRTGDPIAGIPLDRARGSDLVVQVDERCVSPGMTVAHGGQPFAQIGAPREDGLAYVTVPAVHATSRGRSEITIQNAGSECATYTVTLRSVSNCVAATDCPPITLAPSEAAVVKIDACIPEDFSGSAIVTSTQPAAVIAEHRFGDQRSISSGLPQAVASEDGVVSGGGTTLFGPVFFSPESGWDTHVTVSNLDASRVVGADVTFVSGAEASTMRNRICPSSSMPYTAPPTDTTGEPTVGWIRVDTTPIGDPVEGHPPRAAGAVDQFLYSTPSRTEMLSAASYELLPDSATFRWPDGSGKGGTSSGTGLLAVPRLSVRDACDPAAACYGQSDLLIANLVPHAGETRVVVALHDRVHGVAPRCITLGPGEVRYLDLSDWHDLPRDFIGGAIISATHWTHAVATSEGDRRGLVGLAAAAIGVDRRSTRTSIALGVPLDPKTDAKALVGGATCPPP